MTTLSAGVKIWAKTVAFNAALVLVGGAFTGNWGIMGIAFVLLILGFIITLPLLMIIVPLVQLSVIIPYSIKARIAWLTFFLMLIIVAFYMFFNAVFSDPFFQVLTGTTIAALLIAVYTTRRSLLKLYHYHDETSLVKYKT